MTLIRVLNGQKWATFTNQEDFIDYYNNHVANPEKFEKIFQVQITTIF
jgi:hypothetical protein